MKRTVENTILTGFVTVLVLLGTVGVVTQRTVAALIEDNRWVTHTHIVLELLQRLSFEITQAEASIRGYMVTPDQRFESQYQTIKQELPPLFQELRTQTSDNGAEQSRIGPLESAIGQRLQGMDEALQIRKTKGLDAVLATAKTSRGPILAAQITSQIADFRATEERLLADRDARANRSAKTAFVVVLLAVLVAMIAVLGSVLVTFRDLTRRREVDRMKAEFVSVVSHELRTPLTSIHGALGLLASGLLGEATTKGKRMLDIAVSNTDRLIRLINDILDLEKFDSGRMTLRRVSCHARDLIKNAAGEMRAMAQKHNVEFRLGSENALIHADPDRMVQCLTNLMSNAIKFSNSGTAVSVRARRLGSYACFEVSDQGRGIPADMQESIFERFHQVDATDSRNKGGTGLGLAICRTIVRQHGGRIWVESELEKGSTFYFTIPLAGTAAAQPGATEPENVEMPLSTGD